MKVKYEIEVELLVAMDEGEPYEPEDQLEKDGLKDNFEQALESERDLSDWLLIQGYDVAVSAITIKEKVGD